ncbi:type II secretion system protein GspM [Neptuniibacter sp. CAU 1671]|uniref:type II secretion system protein GspM n=1 Tax=Neptuniibacter sp. CAU 1671 TaxID=3032593 RepID=UPI0023DCEA92|nr:type II secretion system protein GspM [Neptuniibacter sp. CAU 1671]MDF2180730.1 type II secretion system protein GspM [Neptuniibacter sp. CAU 1671]
MQLTLKQRRILALLLLVLVVVVIYQVLLGPLLHKYLENADQIDRLEHQLSVYQRVSGDLEQQQEKLRQLRASNPSAGMYLTESRPTLAAAELQQILNRLVGSSGGQLVSTQIIDSPKSEALPAVAIKVRLRCEIDELVALLYSVETHKPVMFVENLMLTSSAQNDNQRARITRRTAQLRRSVALPSLDLRFDLVAYTVKGGS